MLSRMIVLGAAAAAMVSVPGIATAEPPEPPPPPPPPNVNAYALVKPSEFAVLNNTAYAFTTPDGLTCMLQRSGGYGCSGPIPGAPEGANLVSGAIGVVPGFSHPRPVALEIELAVEEVEGAHGPHPPTRSRRSAPGSRAALPGRASRRARAGRRAGSRARWGRRGSARAPGSRPCRRGTARGGRSRRRPGAAR